MQIFKERDGQGSQRYGADGDMKKTQFVLQLAGHPGDIDTMKCLLVAAESGMEMEVSVIDLPGGVHKSAAYQALSPFSLTPVLKEASYTFSGAPAILSYIDARGLGKHLSPHRADLAALQNYWVDIAVHDAGPHVQVLLDAAVKTGADGQADPVLAAALRALIAPLDLLDQQLKGREFIIGEYSFADLHWSALAHGLDISGHRALIDQRPHLRTWFERIRKHKSHCGQNIVGYELLPTLADIRQQQMKGVVINDY